MTAAAEARSVEPAQPDNPKHEIRNKSEIQKKMNHQATNSTKRLP
jgi:hypothetical protein